MKIMLPLLAVVGLVVISYFGGKAEGLNYLFGVVIPYAAVLAFVVGFCAKVVKWASSPVPFRIPTTCGQQKSLPWVKQDKLESPSGTLGVIGRMALEVLAFRSLWRGTSADLREAKQGGQRLIYGSSKWLWLAGLAFHWMFFLIIVRHFRLFTAQVPKFLGLVEPMDRFFQITLPAFYMSDMVIVLAITYLFLRRVAIPQVKHISLAADYFPLLLIFGIVASGMVMRYLIKTDIAGVKQMVVGLVSFRPVIPEGVGPLFFVHLMLVSTLLAYFPISKLMHMGGVFMSPTRNLANNSREKRHINPWNPPVHIHTYAEYEEDFWKVMKSVDLPLDKEYEEKG